MGKRTWRQTKDGFVEVFRDNTASVAPRIHADVAPFVSPIDGSIINTRAQLVAHNQRHGVSNDMDSLREKTKHHLANQQGHGVQAKDKRERINMLVEAYDRASSPDFQRRKQYEDQPLQ